MSIRINSKTDKRIHFTYNEKYFQMSIFEDYVLVMTTDFGMYKLDVSDAFHFLLQFIPYQELILFFDEQGLFCSPSLSNFLMFNYDCSIQDIASAFGVTRQTLYEWFTTSNIKRICAFGVYYRDCLALNNLGIID